MGEKKKMGHWSVISSILGTETSAQFTGQPIVIPHFEGEKSTYVTDLSVFHDKKKIQYKTYRPTRKRHLHKYRPTMRKFSLSNAR